MENNVPSFLLTQDKEPIDIAKVKRAKLSFLDKTIISSAKAAKFIYQQAENATKINFIYKIDPRVKLFSLIYLIVIMNVVNNLTAQLVATAFIFLLYILARFKILQVYRKIFFLAFFFGFLVVFPASLNIITPGKIVFNIFTFKKPLQLWIYYIPQNIGFTVTGFHVVALLFLRVLNSISFSMFIVFTTSFPALLKSFKIIRIPDTLLMIISLAYKYIFILCRTIEETYFALKSRLFGDIQSTTIRNLISGRIFFIFKKSMIIYENTYYAMVSRGYRGKIMLHSQKHFTFTDFAALLMMVGFGIIILLIYNSS
jgi:cobalt/nickel transport system permease protein